eukprot:5797962-Pyramimonas_sp.AAC.1
MSCAPAILAARPRAVRRQSPCGHIALTKNLIARSVTARGWGPWRPQPPETASQKDPSPQNRAATPNPHGPTT